MINKQIKKFLTAHGMSQSELALKMHMSESRLSKMINGNLEPKITDLKLLSEIFNVSIDELIGGESVEAISIIEKAIKEGKDSFRVLLNKDKTWATRKDDKGNDMIFYIKKYNAYEYLSWFYQKNTHVPSHVQVLYVKTIFALIHKMDYDEYLRMVNFKFTWNLSVLKLDETDETSFGRYSSTSIIFEIGDKGSIKSRLDHKLTKKDAQICNGNVIFSFHKQEFMKYCELEIMKQFADPKYILDASRQAAYIKYYLAHNTILLEQKITEMFDKKMISSDIITVYESLVINNDYDKLMELIKFHLSMYDDFSFLDKKLKYYGLERVKEMKLIYFTKFVGDIKNVLKILIKYEQIEMFKQTLLNPKFKTFLDKAREPYLKSTDYGSVNVKPKFFDFEMPYDFKKFIIRTFGNDLYEISLDFNEVLLKESKEDFEFAIEHSDIKGYRTLWYQGQGDLERKINRKLTRNDFTQLYKSLLEVIQDVNQTYLKKGHLNIDEAFKKLVDKSQKNKLLKYYLVKIWVNFGKYTLSDQAYYEMQEQGILGLEKIKSMKEEVIEHIFYEMASPIDIIFAGRYSSLSKIKNLNFLKYILEKLNPFILGRYMKKENISFGEIDKIRLISQYTNEVSNSDLVMLHRHGV